MTHINHVPPHVLIDKLDRDPSTSEFLFGPDTGAHEDLRRRDRAGAEDDFLLRLDARPWPFSGSSEFCTSADELAIRRR